MAMNTSPFGPGALSLVVEVGHAVGGEGGRPLAVEIESTRPVGFSTVLLAGRPAEDVPGLIGRLHALCGRAHAAAAAAAIAAARGGPDPWAVARARFDGLIAERLGEHLRSVFTASGLAPDGAVVSHEMLADIRAVLATARGLDGTGGGAIGPGAAHEVAEAICLGIERLGLGRDRRGRFRAVPGSWAASVLDRVGEDHDLVFPEPDRLSRADDDAVIAALVADPTGFARRPSLPGRRPETGPQVRSSHLSAWSAVGHGCQMRIAARLGEIVEAAELLATDPTSRLGRMAEWVAIGRTADGIGHAAVESPRGRLHHLVRLADDGRIAFHAALAPTEWNFHPEGPLAAALMANRFAPGPEGIARIERIAALFDPCVAFDVRIRERANA